MSDANIDIVRRGYAALQRHDIDEWISYADPDIEFVARVGESEGRVYRGHAGLRELYSDLSGEWDLWMPDPQQFEAAGDVVMVTGTSHLSGGKGVVDMTTGWGQLFHLRDGLVVSTCLYANSAEARREFESAAA